MKLRANKNFEKVTDSTIGRKRKEGEVFEVSEERAKILLEHKGFSYSLVEIVDETREEITEAVEEIKTEEKPKRTRKPREKK